MTLFAPAFQHCRTISETILGLVLAACSGSAIPADVRLHQHDVGAGDEAVDATQFFDGSPHQLFGIISLDDRHLGPSRISRHRMAALQIDGQLWLGALVCSLSQNPRPAVPAATPPRRSSLISTWRRLSMQSSVKGILF